MSLTDWLDGQEFYEVMQRYRHAPIAARAGAEVVEASEAVKSFVRSHVTAAESRAKAAEERVKERDVLIVRLMRALEMIEETTDERETANCARNALREYDKAKKVASPRPAGERVKP